MKLDFSKARVTVVGDRMMDRRIHGRIERLSPEGPWPVMAWDRDELTPGGACNVYQNLVALGVRSLCPETGWLSIKDRYTCDGREVLRVDRDASGPIDADDVFAKATAEPCDVLVLSDYGKGVFASNLSQRLIAWAKERDCKVIVDPKGRDWSKYKGADVVTPNLKEWFEVQSSFDGIGAVLLTRGAEGMSLIRHSQDRLDIPATNKNAVDVCGCGDTVVAALAACLAVGMDLASAAHVANYAAGVVVGKFGTAVCTRAELEGACLKG